MKNIRFIVLVLVLGTLVLSACGAAAAPAAPATPAAVGGGKVEAMPVAFLGTVNSINGNQWVISGTAVTVDPSVIRDGPFNAGDQIKVEGVINADGSFTVSRVEVPAPQDVAGLPQFGDDHGNDANINDDHGVDANVNDDHGNDASINDDHGADANINDDHGNDANINDANTNDDHGGAVSPNNTNDDHGGNSSKDNGGKGSSGGGKGSGGGGSDDGGGHN